MKIKSPLALVITLASLGLAAPALAGCDLVGNQLKERYLALDAAREKANERIRKDARPIIDFLHEFKLVAQEYSAAVRALMEHKKTKPDLKFEDLVKLEGQVKAKEWDTARTRLMLVREQKMASLNAAFARIGNWHGSWNTPGGILDIAPKQAQLHQTHLAIATTMAAFGAEGRKVAAEYTRAGMAAMTAEDDNYAFKNYKLVPPNSGMLEEADQAIMDAKKARQELLDFNEKCPMGQVLAEVAATKGREEDADTVDLDTNKTDPTTKPKTKSKSTNLATLTKERKGRTDTAKNVGAKVALGALPLEYTVKKGDTLTSIAQQLKKDLGSPPLKELIDALYANMNTRSRQNPSLIFAGDVIDLVAVKKDLAA